MMRVKYVGPFDGVDIPQAGLTVARGEVVELSNDVAGEFLAQEGNWERVYPEEPGGAASKKRRTQSS